MPTLIRLLLVTQLMFAIGFYLVMPYLAGYLAGNLALAGSMVGLVLGLRTFSQQGLFLLGGTLADRFGAKPIILLGCAIRTAGFVLLTYAASAALVVAAVILIGAAGALFSPAVESSLAQEAGTLEPSGEISRADVFALFAISEQVGAVVGPLLGTALLLIDFRLTCLTAAAVFTAVGLALSRWLPRRPATHQGEPLSAGWIEVLGNKAFLIFAAGYAAYLLCYNQLYLALPTELRRWSAETPTLGWLFALSSTLVVCGQLPLTTLARRRLGRSRGLAMGFLFMATGFAVVALAVRGQDRSIVLVSCAIMVTLLTLGQMMAVPLAQDLVSLLARERRLGLYFGFLGSAGGFVVLAGNAIVGTMFDQAEHHGSTDAAPWWFLAVVPLVSAVILGRTARRVASREQPLSRVTS